MDDLRVDEVFGGELGLRAQGSGLRVQGLDQVANNSNLIIFTEPHTPTRNR
jgi:hypothetical protein